MSDLIRREDVNDLIKQICDVCGEGEKYNGVMCRCCRFDDFIGVVDNIPSAEPEPKKGEWIDIPKYEHIRCSNCRYVYSGDLYPRDFCPHCGTEMKG